MTEPKPSATSVVPAVDRSGEILAIDGLKVHYKARQGKHPVRAVDGVSLQIRRGETFGLIGESGSGKSTIGRAVMRLVEPTSGRVHFDGKPISAMSRRQLKQLRRRFQIVFQDPTSALDPRKTIINSLREPLEVQGLATPAALDRVDLLLSRVGLNTSFRDRYPHELSGGQKQRVNIARALVLDPVLLVLDEAVSALDVSVQAEVLNMFAALKVEFGLSVLFIGHDLAVVAHISDRIGVMYLGKLMELGPTDEVLDQPLHPYTAALRSAEPEVVPPSDRVRHRILLTGEIPSPTHPPSGCVFHPRCPYAQEVCSTTVPEWRDVGDDRWVACHFVTSVDGHPHPTWGSPALG
ncbi:MAG: peptide transporter substrate-binding protein [Ilumatobacteraceae bacterium]|nr:peptide transporter substrate-binding protein [Ilumatobacteraceae bacterium]